MKYKLEKYKSRSSRHRCPQCGDNHSFTLYVDEAGRPINEVVGRCNHEVACGYHLTPRQWFESHQEWCQTHNAATWQPRHQPVAMPKPSYIPAMWVIRLASYRSSLVEFLCGILTRQQIVEIVDNYGLGSTKQREVIYWQIDRKGKVRTGKIIAYDPKTGHRIKSRNADWVHSRLIREGTLQAPYELRQCLFGEHLLSLYPWKSVAVVEAEKTAVIASAVYPQYNWLATGGISQLSISKMVALRGKDVILFPDTDPDGKTLQRWKEKAKEFRGLLRSCKVSDYLERVATPQQKAEKIDIADILINHLLYKKDT